MSVIVENRVVSQKWWTNWDLFLFYFAMRKGICLLECSCYINTYIVLGHIKVNKNPFYVSWLLLKYKLFAGWVSGLWSMQSSVTHNSARISMFCNISFTQEKNQKGFTVDSNFALILCVLNLQHVGKLPFTVLWNDFNSLT